MSECLTYVSEHLEQVRQRPLLLLQDVLHLRLLLLLLSGGVHRQALQVPQVADDLTWRPMEENRAVTPRTSRHPEHPPRPHTPNKLRAPQGRAVGCPPAGPEVVCGGRRVRTGEDVQVLGELRDRVLLHQLNTHLLHLPGEDGEAGLQGGALLLRPLALRNTQRSVRRITPDQLSSTLFTYPSILCYSHKKTNLSTTRKLNEQFWD